MVSLSESSRHSGGYFFNEEPPSIQITDTEELLRENVTLTEDYEIPFKKIHTPWAIIVQIILSIGTTLMAFLVPMQCVGKSCTVTDVSIVLYVHGGLWFVLLCIDRFYRHLHNTSRLHGYLDFYRRTRHVRRIPFVIASGANVVLLIVSQLLHDHCNVDKGMCSKLTKENYIQIIITLETVATLPFLIIYLVRTVKFNSHQPNPDVNQEEMLSSFLQSQSQSSEIGFKDENYVDQILEKQSDMIRYLKQHNSQLGKRILLLTTENNTLKTRS